jgi:hypothetical protein
MTCRMSGIQVIFQTFRDSEALPPVVDVPDGTSPPVGPRLAALGGWCLWRSRCPKRIGAGLCPALGPRPLAVLTQSGSLGCGSAPPANHAQCRIWNEGQRLLRLAVAGKSEARVWRKVPRGGRTASNSRAFWRRLVASDVEMVGLCVRFLVQYDDWHPKFTR